MKREYTPFYVLAEEAVNPNTPTERLEELVSKNRTLIHLVASNSAASPELLQRLSRLKDSRIREKVTANPNTPIKILFKLGQLYPYHLLSNSGFYLEYIINNKPLDIPSKTLATLIEYDAKLLNLENNSNNLISILFLEKSSFSKSPQVLISLASHPKTPIEVLRKLSVNKDNYVHYYLADNPKTPDEILKKLSSDQDNYVRSRVASHQNTSVEILEKLAKDIDASVRARVAINPKTPIFLLENLSKDDSITLGGSPKNMVASNPNTPISILERLAQETNKDSFYLHGYIVSNIKTPTYIIEKLVKQHLQYLELSIKDSLREEYEFNCFFPQATTNINTPIHVLEKLAISKYWQLRKSVASSPNTPAYILEKLANDEDNSVHLAIAYNSRSPGYILDKIANINNQKWWVLRVIAKNNNTSIELLEQMSKDHRTTIRENAITNLNHRSIALE